MIDFKGVYKLNELLKSLPDMNGEEAYESRDISTQSFPSTGESAKEDGESDEALLREILSLCSEEAKEQLVARHGRNSKIGLLIVKMQAEKDRAKETAREKAKERGKEKKRGNAGGKNGRAFAPDELQQILMEQQHSFYQLLGEKIDARGYESDADFYKSINFPRQLFSKLRRPDYTLHKDNVLWLLAGLRVDYWEAVQLLGAAGYTFRKNIRRDVIIAYTMKSGDYTLDSLNEMLLFFDEKPLGTLE